MGATENVSAGSERALLCGRRKERQKMVGHQLMAGGGTVGFFLGLLVSNRDQQLVSQRNQRQPETPISLFCGRLVIGWGDWFIPKANDDSHS